MATVLSLRRSRELLGGALALTVFAASPAVFGQLQLVRLPEPIVVFGGSAQTLPVTIRNTSSNVITEAIQLRLFQAASGIAAPLGKARDWKRLTVLGDQTVIESVQLDFPEVRVESTCVVRSQTESGTVLGAFPVVVLPKQPLRELMQLSGGRPPGLFDLTGELRTVFEKGEVQYENLDTSSDPGLGRLIFATEPSGSTTEHQSFALKLRGWAKSGAVIVWLKPVPAVSGADVPVQVQGVGAGSMLLVEASRFKDLDTNPATQRELVALARFAIQHPGLVHQQSEP